MPALHCPGFLIANGDLQKIVGMFSFRPPMVVRRKLTCFRRGCGRGRCMRRFSVSFVAEEEVNTHRIRKHCPVLESKPSTTDDIIASNEWKTVPDIQKTSADRYGDKVALVDPYYDPPSTLTYKQEKMLNHQKEEAAIRSNLIQQIILLGSKATWCLIVPNKVELLLAVRKFAKTDELDVDSRHKIFSELIRDELTFWTSQCSFQIGPFLLLDEPFTINSGLLTPTMKIKSDQVVARYSDKIAKLFV